MLRTMYANVKQFILQPVNLLRKLKTIYRQNFW